MVEVLDNGMRVVLQPSSRAAPVVAIQMWVDVGSADDGDETSGLAHVLEHMLFKGTGRRTEGEIAQEIEGSGGQINAWTSFDQTVFHVVMASRFFDRGLDILADAICNSRLDRADLRRELQVIHEEIRQGEDTTSRVVSRNLFANAYRKHPYRRPVIGREATVSRLTRERVKAFYDRWYVPGNMTLVIVGNFDKKRALAQVRERFAGWRRGSGRPPARKRPVEPQQRKVRLSVKHRESAEAYLTMAFHIPGLLHQDTAALDLAAVILGQGESSRLTRRVKHRDQLATTSYSYAYTPVDPGLLVIGATAPPERLVPLVKAVTREALSLGATEVSADELKRARTLVESDVVYQKETVQGMARKLGFYQTVAGSAAFDEEYNRRIGRVTPKQLREVAARHLRPENLSVSVVTPAAKDQPAVARLEAELAGAVRQASQQVRALARGGSRRGARGEDGVLKVTLGNGARLLVLPDPSVPLVALRAVWPGGLRYERPSVNGINSLLAALITRGTTTRTAEEISSAIEGMAGSVSGFSGQNSFGVQAELLSRHWEHGLEIVADCLLNPAFAQQEVERERRVLIEDILAQEDNLASVAMRLFNRTLYTRHPYRMDALGNVTSVGAITRQQLVRFYRRHYRPSGLVLAVVGDVDPQRVEAKFKQLFAVSPGRGAGSPVQIPAEPVRTAPQEAYQLVNKQQAHVVVGYPGADLRSKDRYALEVMTSVLSGQGGRLFAELRDRQGLAYQLGAYSQEGLEPGFVAVYIATSPHKVEQALAGIEQQLQLLKDRRLSRAELGRVRRFLVGSYEISLQRRSTLASYLAFNEAYGLGYRAYARYASEILSVSAADVQRVARKYLVKNKRVVAVVQPRELTPAAAKRVDKAPRAGVVLSDTRQGKNRKKKAKRRRRKR